MNPFAARTGTPRKGLGSVAHNLGWLLAGRGVTAVLSLFYLAIVTRTLGVTDFGRFSIIVGASQVLVALVGFQTWQIIVRYGTAHRSAGDLDRLGRLFRACTALDATSAVVGVGVAATILSLWGEMLGIGPTLWRATFIFTIIQLLSLRSTPLGILRLNDNFSLAALADSATPVVRLVGAGLVALIHPTLQGFLVAWMAAELLTATAYWLMVARTGNLRLMRRHGHGLRAVVTDNPGIVQFAVSTNANATFTLSSKQFPLLLVGGVAGTTAAGEFRLAVQLAQAMTKLSQLLARAAFPEIVRSIDAGGLRKVGKFLVRSVSVATLVAALVFGLLLLGGQHVLALVGGSEFTNAYSSLLWLTAAGCIDLCTVGFEPVLMVANRAGSAFFVRLAATGTMFAAAFLLSPSMGANGIAAGVLIASVVTAVLLALMLGLAIRRDRLRTEGAVA